MAEKFEKVYLGYYDEVITEKYKEIVNFTTNKIGGTPDIPGKLRIEQPKCSLCQLPQPLVVQIHAPIGNFINRTLYLFGCINSNCWNKKESWTCLRWQSLEQIKVQECIAVNTLKPTDWCENADDWFDESENFTEENGNSIEPNGQQSDEDESCSFEESLSSGFCNLSFDVENANTVMDEAREGAVGKSLSSPASAEIEGNEGEVISIDSPTLPKQNISVILQEVTPLPQDFYQKPQRESNTSTIQFIPYFMSVWEESMGDQGNLDHHIRELMQEYEKNSDGDLKFMRSDLKSIKNPVLGEENLEKYESSTPAHGDKMFHHFLTKVQMNPGQILRYSRDNSKPLLISPLKDIPKKCLHCQGDLIFEFQILSTIIPKLRLVTDLQEITRIEFGTVLIFTCKSSCWQSEMLRQEYVVVQSEII